MKSRARAAAWMSTALVASAAALVLPTAAHATGSTPPWEPDPTAVGTITFYDASGNVVTSGPTDTAPFAAYAVGSSVIRAGDAQAQLIFANPDPNSTPPNWYKEQVGLYTPNPLTSGPSNVQTMSQTLPVVAESSDDQTLDGYESDSVISTQAGYENVVQVRLRTASSANQPTAGYDDADLSIDPATHTWTQIYPPVASGSVTTTTTVSASPPTPSTQGTAVTLTATIAASDSSKPAGSVQFTDNGNDLGTTQTVNTTSETATLTTSSLRPGSDSIGAVFSPTDTGTYQGSTATPITYVVNPVASKPTISGTAQVGKTVKCNESVTSGETVKYVWKASGKAVSGGTKQSLKIPASAAGKTLTCTVTVSASGATSSSSATSAGKKVAKGPALKATKKPTLSGPGRVGKTEKVNHGTWSPKATKYAYQWLLNGKAIKHATKSSFKIAKSDKGKKLSCKVTAEATGYNNGTATTNTIKVKS